MNNLLKLVIEKKIKLHTFHHILKLLITYSWLVCGTLYCIYVTNIYDKTRLLLVLNPNNRIYTIKPMNNTMGKKKTKYKERPYGKYSNILKLFWIYNNRSTDRKICLIYYCTAFQLHLQGILLQKNKKRAISSKTSTKQKRNGEQLMKERRR